jgi:hypothetical protein
MLNNIKTEVALEVTINVFLVLRVLINIKKTSFFKQKIQCTIGDAIT